MTNTTLPTLQVSLNDSAADSRSYSALALTRAHQTLAIILKETKQEGIETVKNQALNERTPMCTTTLHVILMYKNIR